MANRFNKRCNGGFVVGILFPIKILWIMLAKEKRKNGLSGNTVDENGNKSDNKKRRQRTQEALCTARSVWSRDG